MESFFSGWITRQEQFLAELLAAPRDDPERHLHQHRDLVARVLAHYHAYYHAKSLQAARDAAVLFSPPWLTPLERAFLWVAGWKPALAFRLLHSGGVRALTADQARAVETLRRETAARERDIGEEMARMQEALAMPEMLRMARGVRDGETVVTLGHSLELLACAADGLRADTVNRLVEILTPVQAVELLAAAGEAHLRLRGWTPRRA